MIQQHLTTFSKGLNRVSPPPRPNLKKETDSIFETFSSFLEYREMDKVQKPRALAAKIWQSMEFIGYASAHAPLLSIVHSP
jgi:hypothetical protein